MPAAVAAEGPHVELRFASPVLSIARFRCPPGDARWSHENWIGDDPHVVFPHVPVAIRQRTGHALVADATQAVLYRADEYYERERLSPDGDRSTFLTVEPGAGDDVASTIASTQVTVSAHEVLKVRLLAELCGRADVDPLEIEEAGLRLVARVLNRSRWSAGGRGSRGARAVSPRPRRAVTHRAHATVVADARRCLAGDPTASRSLAQIGAAVGVSPFHLARLFRAQTGLSLHGYRDQLRLRMALDRLADDDADLTTMAIELGFFSHSHFSDRFKSAYGTSPSRVRALLRRGNAQTRTLMEALRATAA